MVYVISCSPQAAVFPSFCLLLPPQSHVMDLHYMHRTMKARAHIYGLVLS